MSLRTILTENEQGYYSLSVINEMGEVQYMREGIPTKQRAQDYLMKWVLGQEGLPLTVDMGGLKETLMGRFLGESAYRRNRK